VFSVEVNGIEFPHRPQAGSQVLCANLVLEPLALSRFSRKTQQRATRNFR